MSILTLIQTVTDEIAGLSRPSAVVTSTDRNVQRLLALAHRVGKDLRQGYDFPHLQKEGTFVLVTDQTSYALPNDFERWTSESQWDGSNSWQVFGPLSPQEYEQQLRGVTVTAPKKMFTVQGATRRAGQIDQRAQLRATIVPTPTSGDNGTTIYTQYISGTWILPVNWVTGTSYAATSYCNYLGNIYYTVLGGTAGGTPPVHTSGTVTDGTVLWLYISYPYDKFLADTDISIIDEMLIVLGVKYKWLAQNGLDYKEAQAEFDDAVGKQMVAYTGARDLNLITGRRNSSIPDSGYGL